MLSKLFKLVSKRYLEFLLFNFIFLLALIILEKSKVLTFTIIFKYIATFNLFLIVYFSITVLVTFLYCLINKGGYLRKYLTCLAILKTDENEHILFQVDNFNLYKIVLFLVINFHCYIVYVDILCI